MITHSLTGTIHLYSAILAIVFGTYILIAKKGTKTHKKVGFAYVIMMLILNITAFMIYRLFGGFGIFHIAATVSLVTLLAGMIPLIRKKTNNSIILHISFMYWSVIGLYAAFVSESLTRLPDNPFYAMLGIAIFLTCGAGSLGFKKYKNTWIKTFTNQNTLS
ncbi:DUF2306 domain-containing protein [Fulvivirga sp. RKSG066]|uniref:DUF2306 domain-containing protein n=1 Tax=Fulvivirga aurantia TaxID=2529383 RepID=UPI0012BC20A3|nr:DUF2306 domain-containing protein [Fulvivirga aurantia]MTI23218.1 DUF2306 domain-containing protein [Fulvivirga aurantia]